MEEAARENKLESSGKPAHALFPITPKTVRELLKDNGKLMLNPLLPMINIKVAPNTLVVSLVNKTIACQ